MSTTTDNRREADVEFTHEDDTGLVTARDVETGVAWCGETKAEALAMLADAPTHDRIREVLTEGLTLQEAPALDAVKTAVFENGA